MEKTVKKLETEKQELNNIIGEKDLAIQKEAAKVVRAQQDVVLARDDFERRLYEKDEEMDEMRLFIFPGHLEVKLNFKVELIWIINLLTVITSEGCQKLINVNCWMLNNFYFTF